jgi:SAM-dependent methyltransferase
LFSLLRKAKSLVHDVQFLLWKRRHPSASFKDYFIEIVRSDFKRGRAHPTLGPNLSRESFGVSGQKTFPVLARRYSIGPDDTCVDYGCGTLRVGIHAIEYLNPCRYWGMDISELLLAQGAELIGSDLARRKSPNLRVISPASLAEAAAAKPKLVFSVNVLLHVHPDELFEYLTNILTLMGETGIGVVSGAWSYSRTSQIARQSWIHSEGHLREIARAAGGQLAFCPKPSIHIRKASGLIELRPASGDAGHVGSHQRQFASR